MKPRSQSQPNRKPSGGHSSRAKLLREPSFYFKSNGRKSTSADRRSMSEKYLQIGVPMTHLKRPATTSHYSRIESSLSNPVNAIKFHDCQNNHSMTNLRDVRDSVRSTFFPFLEKLDLCPNYSKVSRVPKFGLLFDRLSFRLNLKVNVCRNFQSKSNKNFKELTWQTRNSLSTITKILSIMRYSYITWKVSFSGKPMEA